MLLSYLLQDRRQNKPITNKVKPLRSALSKCQKTITKNDRMEISLEYRCNCWSKSAATCGLPSRKWNLALARISVGRMDDSGYKQQQWPYINYSYS